MSRLALALSTCLVVAVGTAQGARAHAILIQSDPAAGGAIRAGRVTLALRYNSRIDTYRSRLTLTLPDGSQTVLPIQPAPTPDVLRADTLLSPGAYSLRWQVLAVDGHITRGDVPFTVKR
jgi:methionine-rich copper-binding protein CopC